MQKRCGAVVYSPSDLIRFFASPFASWMDRRYLENPDRFTPDEETEDQKLVAQTGDRHEVSVLTELKAETPELVEIPKDDFADAHTETLSAMRAKVPIIFQAALDAGQFAGFADFLILDGSGRYQVWDTKLALTPKPYYAIQGAAQEALRGEDRSLVSCPRNTRYFVAIKMGRRQGGPSRTGGRREHI